MRVLFLGPYPPPYGGIQTHLLALRQFLSSENIPSEVINLTRYRGPETDGVYFPRSALEVLKLLFHLRYDVIHMHAGGNLQPRIVALALTCTAATGRKTVFTFHSGGYPSSPAGSRTHKLTLRALALRRFDRLIAVNDELRRFYIRCGAQPCRIRGISPYAPAQIPEGTELTPELAEFYGRHDPVLLNVAGLEPEYDLARQIEAFELIRRHFSAAGLVIIGSGSLETELRHEISNSPERAHIMMCGDVPHPATLLAIKRCSILLRTSLYDGDAMSVREGLQLGRPVIATDNGMRPPGVILIPPANTEALCDSIESTLRSAPPCTPSPVDDRNLAAVLEVYRELVR